MERRGYPVGGPRSGGISRLATDTGISQATVSRLVNGQGEPSVDSLRKIGNLWGYSLGQMLVFAGVADPADVGMAVEDPATAAEPPVIPDEPPADLPRVLAARYLNFTATERAILWLPDTTPGEREQLVRIWQAIHKPTTDAQAAAREEARPDTVSEMKRRG